MIDYMINKGTNEHVFFFFLMQESVASFLVDKIDREARDMS